MVQLAEHWRRLRRLLYSPPCTKVDHNKHINDAMARVAVALCDTVVRVSAELEMLATTEQHDVFFGQDVEGLQLTQLIHAEDADLFADVLLRVSASHVPECLETELCLASTAVEVTLLVLGVGGAEDGCIVGISTRREASIGLKPTARMGRATTAPAAEHRARESRCPGQQWRGLGATLVTAAQPSSKMGVLSSATRGSAPGASTNDLAFCVPLAGVLPQHSSSLPRDRPPTRCVIPVDAWSADSTPGAVDGDTGAEAARTASLFWISEDSSVGSVAASVRRHQKEVGKLLTLSRDLPWLSENSSTGRSAPLPRMQSEAGVQTEPGPEQRTCGVNTVASWKEGHVVCATCSKPPLLPGTPRRHSAADRLPSRNRSARPRRALTAPAADHQNSTGARSSSSTSSPRLPRIGVGPLDGSWQLVDENPRSLSAWCHTLHILGERALDAMGGALELSKHDGETLLEGGLLTMQGGFLCRTGKSGRVLKYVRVEGPVERAVRRATHGEGSAELAPSARGP